MSFRITLCLVLLLGFTPRAFSQCVTGADPGDVLTHWSTATNSFVLGATGQVPFAPSPDYASPMYSYGPAFLPDYDDYLADNYSKRAVNHAQAVAHMTTLRNNMLAWSGWDVPFYLYNPMLGDVTVRLLHAPGCVQIIHGVVVDNSFVTVILPPNWNKFAPPGTYPIVAHAAYDVNDNFFGSFGLANNIAMWIAESGIGGRTGAIGVIWNGGGGVTSTTTNDYARHQFASIIDLVANSTGGDRYNIIMGGQSRGGTATLMMASNPESYNYRVTFALATGFGAKLGTHASLISATMSAQLGAFGESGFANGWRPGWTYPAVGRPTHVGLNAVQSLLRLISGNTDPGFVDTYKSPISNSLVNGLKTAGTQVLLNYGSHDAFIPFGTQMEYLAKLRLAGVPVEAHIMMRGGHGDLPGIWGRFRCAMFSYISPSEPCLSGRTVDNQIHYYKVNQTTHNPDLFTPLNLQQPFTLEIPRFVYHGMPIVIMASSEPGTEFYIYTNKGPLYGAIGPAVTDRHWTLTVATTGPETITITAVHIRKPGWANFVAIDPTRVPGTSPMTVNIQVFPGPAPNVRGGTMSAWLKNPCSFGIPLPCMARVPTYPEVNWGISEY